MLKDGKMVAVIPGNPDPRNLEIWEGVTFVARATMLAMSAERNDYIEVSAIDPKTIGDLAAKRRAEEIADITRGLGADLVFRTPKLAQKKIGHSIYDAMVRRDCRYAAMVQATSIGLELADYDAVCDTFEKRAPNVEAIYTAGLIVPIQKQTLIHKKTGVRRPAVANSGIGLDRIALDEETYAVDGGLYLITKAGLKDGIDRGDENNLMTPPGKTFEHIMPENRILKFTSPESLANLRRLHDGLEQYKRTADGRFQPARRSATLRQAGPNPTWRVDPR